MARVFVKEHTVKSYYKEVKSKPKNTRNPKIDLAKKKSQSLQGESRSGDLETRFYSNLFHRYLFCQVF